jgi:hypothetical protein
MMKDDGRRIDTYTTEDNSKSTVPPPTEITCIKVKKVYNECMHSQVDEVLIEFENEGNAADLTAQCGVVKVLEQSCKVIREGLVKVKATLEVSCRLDGIEESEEFTIEKTLRLSRAGEKGLEVQCQILPKCLSCFVSGEEEDEEEVITLVTACVGILILVKLVAEVQLLVPAYGFCPEPPECEEVLNLCPDFNPAWPPYPSQDT